MRELDPATLIKSAVAALNKRNRKEVARLLRELIRLSPPIDHHWASVSRMASAVGETTTAIEAARKCYQAKPSDLERVLQYGGTLGGLGRVREALEIGWEAMKLAPGDANPHNLVATCQSQLGNTAAAIEAFRETLRLQPTAGPAWFSLGEIYPIGSDPVAFARLQDVCKSARDPEDRGASLYALGRAYDGLGEYDRAFAAYQEGAAILRKRHVYDWQRADALRDRAIEEFDVALAAALSPSACASDRTIFVVGMPRSGTTLVEQILCTHSGVAAGAEHGLFRTAGLDLQFTQPGGYLEYQRRHGPSAWTNAAEDFLGLVEDRLGPGRTVDKALTNTRIMGILAHSLPQAPIVWLRRGPADVAWSCFRLRFTQQHDWAWSLADIARYMRDEDRIWRHWSHVLGDRILTVPYEDLVYSPDDWMKRILSHCGLQFEEGVKDFHLHDRAVMTSSVAQVRQPISTSSIGQWRNYEAHLKPFIEAYHATQ